MRLALSGILVVLLLSTGCGGATSATEPSPSNPVSPFPAGGAVSPSPAGGTSSLTVMLKDSPFSDAKALLVTFSQVNVHASGADWLTLPFAGSVSSRTCDLKKLQTAQDILGVGSLPAGHYTQLRLVVSSAAIYFDSASSGDACAPAIAAPPGTAAPVEVPSGELKLNREFELASGGATTILLDFDGDKSVKLTGSGGGNGQGRGNGGGTGGRYIMTPVIGIVSVQ